MDEAGPGTDAVHVKENLKCIICFVCVLGVLVAALLWRARLISLKGYFCSC